MDDTVAERQRVYPGNWVRPPVAAEIAAARARLSGRVAHTPVLRSPALRRVYGEEVWLKCEQFQPVGAFKLRGATNAVQSLSRTELKRGVATHSSGNHGAALAWAAREAGARCRVIMPRSAVASKRAAVRRYGGEVVDCGPSQADREARLAEVLAATGAVMVHPYDDARVIAGQASTTIELLEAIPEVGTLVVPVGGGGLCAGAILAARWLSRSLAIIGVEPVGADDTRRSLDAGHRVALDRVETCADGLRAQVGEATFPVLESGLADLVTVDEAAILAATRWAVEAAKLVIEPSAAIVLAALFQGRIPRGKGGTAVIISGGNLDFDGAVWRRARLATMPGE